MSVSISGGFSGSGPYASGITKNITGKDSFQAVQLEETISTSAQSSQSASQNSKTDWVSSDPDAPVSGDGWTWTVVAPGVEKGTAPDGSEVGYCNIDMVLTPEDKALVGWPCEEGSDMSTVACMIANDRACGDLTGPVTLDYILGNEDKHISGVADRFLVSDDTVSELINNYNDIYSTNEQS
ncbi:hypothetical protein ELZ88_24510 (plasmid) [Salmonella enterica subsp. enterica serovar Karamoja]|uniref:Uncharacterized protein n=1 Tax=Salmonella enterica subsp. enterica serovar Karamoja TaxID=2500153 RepID=A0A3Q9MT08_SALET|nr:hypothetical protein [Salmonella enterica]AZT39691.1 hypothetical protein ELZ88_24510 [Salmonella enterica subsp. enterica serovar Karamoja]AZT44409.1 hypothetical protein EL007_24435 [Salmonella enterica subsp. enterica serovar Karamoja]